MSDRNIRDFLEAIDSYPPLYARLYKPLSWEEILSIGSEFGFDGLTEDEIKKQVAEEYANLQKYSNPSIQSTVWKLESSAEEMTDSPDQPYLTFKAIKKLKTEDRLAAALGVSAIGARRRVIVENYEPARSFLIPDQLKVVEVDYFWKASISPSFYPRCEIAVMNLGKHGYRAVVSYENYLEDRLVSASFPQVWIDALYNLLSTDANTIFNLERSIAKLDGTNYTLELQQGERKALNRLVVYSDGYTELINALLLVANNVVENAIQKNLPNAKSFQSYLDELTEHL